MESTPAARLSRALDSLEGLSVGDAFGEGFFVSSTLAKHLLHSDEFDDAPYDALDDRFVLREFIDIRRLDFRTAPWKWTDDTALSLEIVANLRDFGEIEPDALSRSLARRYSAMPARGYGGAMHELLPQLAFSDWRVISQRLFGGQGSFGNGAAMRAAPIGAYFADDLALVVENAALSARVTHAHFEGVAGAVAVALAAALAAKAREAGVQPEPPAFLDEIIALLPEGEVKLRCAQARNFGDEVTSEEVADFLGSGENVSAQDTVPFCLWCAAQFLPFYEEALWHTVAGLGDRDTTCAVVGGIVAAFTGAEGIPRAWRENREELGEF